MGCTSSCCNLSIVNLSTSPPKAIVFFFSPYFWVPIPIHLHKKHLVNSNVVDDFWWTKNMGDTFNFISTDVFQTLLPYEKLPIPKLSAPRKLGRLLVKFHGDLLLGPSKLFTLQGYGLPGGSGAVSGPNKNGVFVGGVLVELSWSFKIVLKNYDI